MEYYCLPNQFVLKCTHDSGGIIIVKDKNNFDKKSARKLLERNLIRNFYYCGREWPYKNVPPRIIAEKYMEDSQDKELYQAEAFSEPLEFHNSLYFHMTKQRQLRQ